MRIRMAGLEDAAALLAIYAPYVRETAITFEYDVPSEKEFAGRIAHTAGEISVSGCGKRRRNRRLCVCGRVPSARGLSVVRGDERLCEAGCAAHGVGRKLYDAMETILSMQRLTNVEACIAVPSAPDAHLTLDSVRFHEKMGYRMIGAFHQCGYKFDTWYDMVWMEKHIGEHVHPQPPILGIKQIEKEAGEMLSPLIRRASGA